MSEITSIAQSRYISPDQSMKMKSNKDDVKQNFIKGVSEINDEVYITRPKYENEIK